jgi:quinol-cytochrome oxidoreductase complex cytochrome b subunit
MTETAKSWAATRFPALAAWQHGLTSTQTTPRERPYLAALPILLTGGLVFLALSGFSLALHYNPFAAFDSLQFIDRSINNGWLVHGFHESGTTMVLGAAYWLVFRSMLTGSYRAPGELVWLLAVALLALLLVAGYFGYTLSGGAVSYWSLTEATRSLGGGLPGQLQAWVFGGPAGSGSLARLIVLHVALAVAIFGVLAVYFSAAKAVALKDVTVFHPHYAVQVFVAFVVFALILGVLVFFVPHFGENPLNLAAANPLLVPAFVTPPWYLLPVTALGNTGGPLLVIAAFLLLAALPWLDRGKTGPKFWQRLLVWLLGLDIIFLCIATSVPSAFGPVLVTIFIAWYFLHFLVLTPLVSLLEAA